MGLLDNVLHALWALRSYDTSGSMIALSVSEISALDGFCDEEQEQHQLEEWGILVIGSQQMQGKETILSQIKPKLCGTHKRIVKSVSSISSFRR